MVVFGLGWGTANAWSSLANNTTWLRAYQHKTTDRFRQQKNCYVQKNIIVWVTNLAFHNVLQKQFHKKSSNNIS